MIINIIYNLSWFLSVVSEKQIALMIILLSTSQMSKKEEILEFAHWWSKLSQHSKHLQSFFLLNSTVGCLLIDEAEAFVFTSVSGEQVVTVVTKPPYGILYQTTQLVVTTEIMLSIFFLLHFNKYS